MRPSSSPSDVDRRYLNRTEELAERGRGRVHPNPLVGCVLVRDDVVVGEGYHAVFGGPHAEIVALANAGELATQATAYVSLEPCAHRGKTGPCAEALAEAGVTRVVFGAADPGPGAGGSERLRTLGVEVAGPVWGADRGAMQNPAFFHVHGQGTPYVALKLATSSDGKIAERSGQRTRISGAEAGRWVHALRREFDAILIGSGTAVTDDPRLTARGGGRPTRPPARVVLDSSLSLTPDARLFEDVAWAPLHIFCGVDVDDQRRAEMEGAGAAVHPIERVQIGLSLPAVMDTLWREGFRSILCEGGGVLASGLLAQDLVQCVYILRSPMSFGEPGVPAFPAGGLDAGWTERTPVESFGRDRLITYDRITRTD